jgi:hypothetical protein
MSNLATLRPFTSENQPKLKNHGHKGPYLTPILRKLLEKKITFEDPETRKLVEGRIKDVLMLRLILNGTEGETKAIEAILDRLDGKVPTPIQDVTQDENMLKEEITYVQPSGNGHGKEEAIERYKGLIA